MDISLVVIAAILGKTSPIDLGRFAYFELRDGAYVQSRSTTGNSDRIPDDAELLHETRGSVDALPTLQNLVLAELAQSSVNRAT